MVYLVAGKYIGSESLPRAMRVDLTEKSTLWRQRHYKAAKRDGRREGYVRG